MARNGLDSSLRTKSICSLIKTAHQCGVSRLKIGDLEVRFFDPARQPGSQQEDFPEFAESYAKDSEETGEDSASPKIPKELVERFAEEQQLLDDPLAFEQAQIDLQLNRATGGDEEA